MEMKAYLDVYAVIFETSNGPEVAGVYTEEAQVSEVVRLLRRYHELGYMRADVKGIEVKLVDVSDVVTHSVSRE